jgi:hypothetical protein
MAKAYMETHFTDDGRFLVPDYTDIDSGNAPVFGGDGNKTSERGISVLTT